MKKNNITEEKLNIYTEKLIARMESMTLPNWQQGWLDSHKGLGLPKNLRGRCYSGLNSFFLLLAGAEYSTDTWITFNQAQEMGLSVKKGEKSLPVFYWNFLYVDEDGNKIDPDDPAFNSETTKRIPYLKSYNVFNVDQTNMSDTKPEKYAALLIRDGKSTDVEGMYENADLDALIEGGQWLCPVHTQGTRAFYSPLRDEICVPRKALFKVHEKTDDIFADGQEYYSTAIHEMIHSTGAESRLNRAKHKAFADPIYAKEELVAELSSAVIGASLGFSTRVQDNNAAYLKGWIKALREEPKFIISVLSDVSKAIQMFFDQMAVAKVVTGSKDIHSMVKIA